MGTKSKYIRSWVVDMDLNKVPCIGDNTCKPL